MSGYGVQHQIISGDGACFESARLDGDRRVWIVAGWAGAKYVLGLDTWGALDHDGYKMMLDDALGDDSCSYTCRIMDSVPVLYVPCFVHMYVHTMIQVPHSDD